MRPVAPTSPQQRPVPVQRLVALRWIAIAGQGAMACAAAWVLDFQLPAHAIAAILVGEALFNIATMAWLRRGGGGTSERALALQLGVDIVALTGLLYFTGGPENPFNSLYLVHVVLASVVAPRRLAWASAALSASAFGLLFFASVPLEVASAGAHAGHGMMHHGHGGHGSGSDAAMMLHMRGMWVAFVVAAGLLVWFVSRLRADLDAQREALTAARRHAERAERVAALGTLAAGAAHELASPLAAIAVAAAELDPSGDTGPEVETIRASVDRCTAVLSRLSAETGAVAGAAPSETRVDALLQRVSSGEGARVTGATIELDAPDTRVETFVDPVVAALRPLFENAVAAAGPDGRVVLRARVARDAEPRLRVEIDDDGDGIAPDVLARVGEPFFTTRPVGAGAGLGVFTAKTIAAQLGGDVRIASTLGRGTTVVFEIPLEAAA